MSSGDEDGEGGDDPSDGGSGDGDDDDDDASSIAVSSGEEAGMLVSANTDSPDEDWMGETDPPERAVAASQHDDSIAERAYQDFLKETESPQHAVLASQPEDSRGLSQRD